jgi:hypothetical protein
VVRHDRDVRFVPQAEASKTDFSPSQVVPDVELERCFLRLCNLPNYALDRLSRYESTLWRQAGQILFALDNLDRRKPQERMRRMSLSSEQHSQASALALSIFGAWFIH